MAVAPESRPLPVPRVAEKPVEATGDEAQSARPRLVGNGQILVWALLVVLVLAFFYPFVWLISASLKPQGETFTSSLLPQPLIWQHYLEIWSAAPALRWFFNSALVGILASVAVVFSSALVAFGFVYQRFRGRNALFGLVIATLMLPQAVVMVPKFLIWHSIQIGGTNLAATQVPLWAGNLFASPIYIFLLRQFFLGLPRDLFEAAKVDGANPLRIWWSIVLPLSKPALVAVGIFEFKASWTDLMAPLIYLQNRNLFTLPLGLKAFVDEFGKGGIQRWDLVMTASVLFTIPMLVIFFLGQKHFIRGIATTGMK
ncbi:MAG: carbohydrate ABC transporter permease [Candidatus Dormibacteraeota bacterium]|nr:carbohydrate ABC transporter permease [Candidatus Dormibacteraeota bacterium]